MGIFKLTGNIYVDPYFGNDTTGTGTKLRPYATANKAATVATSGQTIILGSGEYKELITGAAGKALIMKGEGTVRFNGDSLAASTTVIRAGAFITLDNITFYKFQGTKLAADTTQNTTYNRCRFYYCRLGATNSNTSSFTYCIFRDMAFTYTGSGETVSTFKNCVFNSCGGTLSSWGVSTIFINNHCLNTTFSQFFPTLRPVNAEVDFNNIVNTTFGGVAYASLPSWTKTNSISNGTNVFNDVDTTRNDLTIYKDDYTLQSASPNKATGKGGEHIGAYNVGYSYSAATIWAAKTGMTGLVLNASSTIRLDSGFTEGDLTTAEIDLGAVVTFDYLRVLQQIIYGSDAIADQVVNYYTEATPDNAINQKTTYEVLMAWSNTPGGASTYKKMETGNTILWDGGSYGNADDSFDPTTQSYVSARYIRFQIKLRSA